MHSGLPRDGAELSLRLPKSGLARGPCRRYRSCDEALRLISAGRLQSHCSIDSATRLQCPPPPWTAAASPIARRRHDDADRTHDIESDMYFDTHIYAEADGSDDKFAQSAAR
jgi:hypothetical protein